VVIRPLISEKAATLAGANQYVFIVRRDANRLQVRQAVKRMYNVSPISINMLNMKGKEVQFGRRKGTQSDWKKAIITLPKGETINVYEGV
jgi:large subunit ribosomal protein L23